MLALLVIVTVSPIGVRPISGEPVWLERAGAYAVFALVFCVGYPRKRLLVLLFAVAAAGALEAAQTLQPSRHGRLPDFYVKAAGCGLGWLTAYIFTGLDSLRQRWLLPLLMNTIRCRRERSLAEER